MDKLEHIGIAVKNLDESNKLFARLLGKPHYKIEVVELEGVRTSFFEVGGIKIELLEAIRSDSAIAKFIEKRGEGLHHLAFGTNEIESKIKELSSEGFTPLSARPTEGADNKMIVFLHPATTNRLLVELCQDKS
jgi:methylmalonyl-CoA/ethylmalonyl-CoA epimerase